MGTRGVRVFQVRTGSSRTQDFQLNDSLKDTSSDDNSDGNVAGSRLPGNGRACRAR